MTNLQNTPSVELITTNKINALIDTYQNELKSLHSLLNYFLNPETLEIKKILSNDTKTMQKLYLDMELKTGIIDIYFSCDYGTNKLNFTYNEHKILSNYNRDTRQTEYKEDITRRYENVYFRIKENESINKILITELEKYIQHRTEYLKQLMKARDNQNEILGKIKQVIQIKKDFLHYTVLPSAVLEILLDTYNLKFDFNN